MFGGGTGIQFSYLEGLGGG
jgi:hypothetical protein